MKRQILFMASLMFLLTITLSAQERGRQGGMEDGKGSKEHFVAKLELSEAQQTAMENLKVEHYKEVLPIRNTLDEKRASLKTLTTSATIDQKKIDKTIEEIGELSTKMLKAKTNHQIALRSMLDDKQKMMFDQRKHRHGKHERDQRGPRGK
jgi:Spy/CpxP family protein refolding chaperone